MLSISIIGIGRLGGALAIALSKAGFYIDTLVPRRLEQVNYILKYLSPQPRLVPWAELSELDSDVVLITVGDSEISDVSAKLRESVSRPSVILHTSGSLSSEILYELSSNLISIGSLHPLVSISDSLLGATRFEGAHFCVEGDEKAVKVATGLATSLRGRPFSIATEYKALYHAGAVMSAGHVVALFDMAVEMLIFAGFEKERARDVLLPLLASTVDNLHSQPSERALTGTFARADANGFQRHLAALTNLSDDIAGVYLALGQRSLDLALAAGADSDKVKRLRESILMAKRNCE